jgi:hypothetical protein
MPAPKSLDQHVRDGTFRARRHRELLAGPVVEWPALALLQASYVATQHELERRVIAVKFERAVRRLGASEDERDRLAAEQREFEEIVTGEPVEIDEANWRALADQL